MKERPDPSAADAGFLGRWARRKSALRRGEQPPEPSQQPPRAGGAGVPADPAPPTPAAADTAATPGAGATPEAEGKPPLPDVETLDESSDFSPFMSREVDAGLRRAALRRLFRSPSLNVTDGLDDYAEDYTSFAPLGDMVTADMRFKARREAERLAREERERELAAEAGPQEESVDAAPADAEPAASDEPVEPARAAAADDAATAEQRVAHEQVQGDAAPAEGTGEPSADDGTEGGDRPRTTPGGRASG